MSKSDGLALDGGWCEPAAVPGRPAGATCGVGRRPGKRWLAFAGPGYLVAVGYMDPGNWATALAGGSRFGYALLSVVLLSSLIAMMLQAAAVRLGLAGDMNLAQACRRYSSPRLRIVLWLGCELAIIACNVAEVLGMACGLQLVFNLPLSLGVCVTALDVFLALRLRRRGLRQLEVLVICLTLLVVACFALELWWLHPAAAAVTAGFIPSAELLSRPDMLYVGLGILGATVMPHNLYLHSELVRGRAPDEHAIRYATTDSNIALTLAFLVNVAILVVAAAAFHRPGLPPVSELSDAHRLLSPIVGVQAASTLFGLGLICSGLSSSITGTLAGQIVTEGFLDLKIEPHRRAWVTRGLAIVPAAAVAMLFGASGAGRLLIFSQVVLSLQLPFAAIPLVWFTTSRRHLGRMAFRPGTAAVLWCAVSFVVAANVWALYQLL